MSSEVLIETSVLQNFLSNGGWSPGANENLDLRERLKYDFVQNLIDEYKAEETNCSRIAQLGLIVLTTSVAEWGVQSSQQLPADPAGADWSGPRPGRGKHLMSYTIGGVGIAHADTSYLGAFMKFVLEQFPDIGSSTERAAFRDIANDLADGGATYDSLRNAGGEPWHLFTQLILSALRKERAQQWLIEQWLLRYWLPSYDAVLKVGGAVKEAFVNARIRNSSAALATCALKHARTGADAITLELEAYANREICAHANPDYRARRWGYMWRPVVLFT